MIAWLGRIAVAGTIMLANLPANLVSAESACTPLSIARSGETQVAKNVSPPSTGITHSNWNTDFTVPNTQSYRRYVAEIMPRDSGAYDIHMFLKYKNGTADEVFSQVVQLQSGQSFRIPGLPRLSTDPYQVNLEIGGIAAIGHTYTLSVSGCN